MLCSSMVVEWDVDGEMWRYEGEGYYRERKGEVV